MDPKQPNDQQNQNLQDPNSSSLDPSWLESLNNDIRKKTKDPNSAQTYLSTAEETELLQKPKPSNPNTYPNMVSLSPEYPPVDIGHQENVSLVEIGHEMTLDPEVSEYMQRVEQDKINLDQPIVVHGAPVVQPAHWKPHESISLPTTKQTILNGLDAKVFQSVRWLAEWCVRMVKKFHGKVVYSDAPTKEQPSN